MYVCKETDPLSTAAFDVQNPQYAPVGSDAGALSGYGDYVGPYPARYFETGQATGVGDAWVTVELEKPYRAPVVVCAPVTQSGMPPAVVRVRNVGPDSFDVRMQNPSGDATSSTVVHYLAMESGAWTLADGTRVEASRVDGAPAIVGGDWSSLTSYEYQQTYESPVVLGQVMTAEDSHWSVFAATGFGGVGCPDADGCLVGRHVGEDTVGSGATETVGVIVMESTDRGIVEGIGLRVFVGSPTVRGVGEAPPYVYEHDLGVAPVVGVVSQAGQTAYDGGWATLYGPASLTNSVIGLAIDEDQVADPERTHCGESVGAFLAGSQVAATLWNVGNHAPYFVADPLQKRTAAVGWPYALSLAGDAEDPDAGDFLTFSKLSGPAWLTVAEDGALGGTPSDEDIDESVSFLVRVEDRRGAYDTATLVIPVRATSLTMGSQVNPAWFEGSMPDDASAVYAYATDGTSVTVVAEDASRWYLDNGSESGLPRGVVLQEGSPVSVALVAALSDGSFSSVTQEFSWQTTDVFESAGTTVTLRRGDSLLLTVCCDGALLELDTDGDGVYDVASTPSSEFPVAFDVTGSVAVTARIDGDATAVMPVLVIEAAVSTPIACQKDYKRQKDIGVFPAGASSRLVWVPADAESMYVTSGSSEGTSVGLVLQPLTTGTVVLQSRLGAVDGPILSESKVGAFEMRSDLLDYVKAVGSLEDGTRLVETNVQIVPYLSGLDFHFHIFSVGATFLDSTIDMEISSDLFEEDGSLLYHVLALHDSICMWCKIYQDGVIVGELN